MARDNGISSTALAIEKWIAAQPEGAVILASDAPAEGERKTITNLLAAAAKKGLLERVAAGIYVKPRNHPLLGRLLPGPEAIAQAIARRDGARLIPTGALALNQLNLSTQVPMRIVYLTDGTPRTIKIGKAEVRFRKAPLKLLAMKGKLSQLATLALRELGATGVDAEAAHKLVHTLTQEDLPILRHDASLVTAWMQPYFQKAIKAKQP